MAILVITSHPEDHRREQCTHLISLMKQMEIASPLIGVGKIKQGLENIPASYLKSYIAMNEKMGSTEEEQLYFYEEKRSEEIAENIRSWILADEGDVTIYLQSLCSVDQKTALSMMEKLRKKMNESHNSILNITYTRFELFSKALSVCEETIKKFFIKRRMVN